MLETCWKQHETTKPDESQHRQHRNIVSDIDIGTSPGHVSSVSQHVTTAPRGSRQRPHIGKLVVKNSRTRQSLVWEQYGATKMLKISKEFYKDHYKETLRRTYLCISQLQHSQINV